MENNINENFEVELAQVKNKPEEVRLKKRSPETLRHWPKNGERRNWSVENRRQMDKAEAKEAGSRKRKQNPPKLPKSRA